jgi:ABC-type uncharacterized transport system permease subunit
MTTLTLSLAATIAMLPAALRPLRRTDAGPDTLFWWLLAVAVLGPVADVAVELSSGWHTGLSATLWVTVAASALLFAGLAWRVREAWRLAPLMLGYLVVLGLVATAWTVAPASARVTMPMGAWLLVHIVLSVGAYALATGAAVAGVSVFLQERALKAKRPTRLTAILPSVADSERLQIGLLAAACVVLGVDILSGMAVELVASGQLLRFSHKTLLTMLAFLVIAGLLLLHYRTGVRGRRAARLVLLAYLLLTLGYPGVKFVTDVLMA